MSEYTHGDYVVRKYTPTTEQVRTVYGRAFDNRKEEFDRWLAEVKAEAWAEGWCGAWDEAFAKDNPYLQGETE